jgi:hypothetical protein
MTLEFRRAVEEGALRLALRTRSARYGRDPDHRHGALGRIGLRFNDPALGNRRGSLRRLQANVSMMHGERNLDRCPAAQASGTYGQAGIHTVLFNDGSSTGPRDRTGDVSATLLLSYAPATAASGPQTWVETSIKRCRVESCSLVDPWSPVRLDRTVVLGESQRLTIGWQPVERRIVFIVARDDGTDVERRAVTWSGASTRPVGYVHEVRLDSYPGTCWGTTGPYWLTMSADARFDDVRIETAP